MHDRLAGVKQKDAVDAFFKRVRTTKSDREALALFHEMFAMNDFVKERSDADGVWNLISPIAYRPPQVARMLNVHVKTVFKWLKAGKLQSHKIDGTTLITREQIEAFLKSH
jgi:excisionase family DNA binding protein